MAYGAFNRADWVNQPKGDVSPNQNSTWAPPTEIWLPSNQATGINFRQQPINTEVAFNRFATPKGVGFNPITAGRRYPSERIGFSNSNQAAWVIAGYKFSNVGATQSVLRHDGAITPLQDAGAFRAVLWPNGSIEFLQYSAADFDSGFYILTGRYDSVTGAALFSNYAPPVYAAYTGTLGSSGNDLVIGMSENSGEVATDHAILAVATWKDRAPSDSTLEWFTKDIQNVYQLFEAPKTKFYYSSAVTANIEGNQTLQPVTQVATPTVRASAQATQTLQPVTQVATAKVSVSLQANQTLAPVTQVATASATVGLSANQTLQPVSQVATSTVEVSAQANQTLAPITQVATATVGDARNISANQTLAPVTQTALAGVNVAIEANQTLQPINQTATIAGSVSLQGNQTLAPVTQVATATVGDARNLSANQTLQPVTQVATSRVRVSAQGNQTLAPVTQVATATNGNNIVGNQILRPVTQVARAGVTLTLNGNQTLTPITQVARMSIGVRKVVNPIVVNVAPNPLLFRYTYDEFIVRVYK